MPVHKINRIKLITYKCQRKKVLKSVYCRYLAKSHVVNCNAEKQEFKYVNFRGSIFTKINFRNCQMTGCDFWGTTFNNCDFSGASIFDCVFVGCRFKNCNFSKATIKNSVIVNTSLAECHNIFLSERTVILKTYPKCTLTDELITVLEDLKTNNCLRIYKILHISDKKYNELNLFLLQQRFSIEILPQLLRRLASRSIKKVTTYKKLEMELKNIEKENRIK